MKDNSILNKVRELLGMEVKLGTRKLDDGVTTIEAEEFEAGFQVVIVKKENEELKSELEKFSKVENNENTNEEVVEETKEEVKEEVVELSEEKEVEAAAKPITHNPENKKKTEHIQYSAKRQRTTLDRVMEKLSK